jgi:hypothetical protein
MVNTKERAKELLNQIKELNPKKDKIKIQDLLANIEGIFAMLNKDLKRKEFRVIYSVFEEVNPAWIPFHKILFKLIAKTHIDSEEWLMAAKEILESMLKKEADIYVSSGLYSLTYFEGVKVQVEEKVEDLYRDIEALSVYKENPTIEDEDVKNYIKKLIAKTDQLLIGVKK